VLTLIGVAFYFVSKLVGGHRELERATDSGNLNVAKLSVRSPRLNVFVTPNFSGPFDIADPNILAEVQRNFSELADPSNGQIDLLVYDRLVAQCFIAALNAAADNGGVNPNPLGIARAQQMIHLLDDPDNGVGVTLARKLKQDAVLDQNFAALADANTVRMLQPQGQTQSIMTDKDISFMVRGKASNVVLNPAVLPPPFTQANLASDFITKNGTTYFVGYTPLTVPNVTDNPDHTIMAVPLRPGEYTHLVNDIDFHNLQPSPLAGPDGAVHTRIPPNAFQSGGLALDGRTVLAQTAVSCAIAGSLQTFVPNVPNGYIVIANGLATVPRSLGAITFAGGPQCINTQLLNGNTNDIFSGVLMEGLYISKPEITDTSKGYAISLTDPDCIANFRNKNKAHMDQFGTPLHDTELVSAVSCLYGSEADREAIALGLALPDTEGGANQGNSQVRCDNTNVLASEPNPNSTCVALLPYIESKFGGVGGGITSGTACLSALDSIEEHFMLARSLGDAFAVPILNSCTGATATPLAYGPRSGTELDSDVFSLATIQTGPPTLNQLIGPNGTFRRYALSGIQNSGNTAFEAATIYDDIIQRLHEIKPTVSNAEIQGLFNQPIPTSTAGTLRFIFLDTSDPNPNNQFFRFTDASGLPARINPNRIIIDGTTFGASTQTNPSPGVFQGLPLVAPDGGPNALLDQGGDGGYPHPYDCVDNPNGSSVTTFNWTPSSGMDGPLGFADLYQCVTTQQVDNFDCPC
jgi:hypothetical protein